MELLRNKSSYRSKAVKCLEEDLTVREFHLRGCQGSTKGESWEMGILYQGKSLQFLLDKRYRDGRGNRLSHKGTDTVERSITAPDRKRGKPGMLWQSTTRQLQTIVERVITVIKNMVAVQVEQAPEWKKTMLEMKARLDELEDSCLCIGLIGFPGVGKSSFLNSVLKYDSELQSILPVSTSDVCTAVPILVKRRTMTPDEKPFKGTVNMISFEEFCKECEVLLNDLNALDREEADEDENRSRNKLQALFGVKIEEERSLEQLRDKSPKVWSYIEDMLRENCILVVADSGIELRRKLRKYLTTEPDVVDGRKIELSALVTTVEIEASNVDILEQGVVFCDLPGLESENKARSETTKEFLAKKCDHAWVFTGMPRNYGYTSLSEFVDKQLVNTTLTEKTYDIVVTKTEDGIDNVDEEEFESKIGKCSDADIPCLRDKSTTKKMRESHAVNRAKLLKNDLSIKFPKQQVEARGIEYPNVLLVSSQEHDKLVKKDLDDPPRMFEKDEHTGIPEARVRAQTLARLNAVASLEDISDDVDTEVSQIWTCLAEYEPKQRQIRKTREEDFETKMKNLEDESLQMTEMFDRWTAPMSTFYMDAFYPSLKTALQKQEKNLNKVVSSWSKMNAGQFKCTYNRGGRYAPQQRVTRQHSTGVRGDFDFVRDLTKEIISLDDLWQYDFNEIIANTLKEISDGSTELKEQAKKCIKPLIAVEWSDKSRQGAEKELDRSMGKTMRRCKSDLRGIIVSFSATTLKKIEESVESDLSRMFEKYKGHKVQISILKKHVRDSMEEFRRTMFETMFERGKIAANDLKQRIVECGKEALKAVIEEARSCYKFMWSDIPEGPLKDARTGWMTELEEDRRRLDGFQQYCKELTSVETQAS